MRKKPRYFGVAVGVSMVNDLEQWWEGLLTPGGTLPKGGNIEFYEWESVILNSMNGKGRLSVRRTHISSLYSQLCR